MRYMVTGSTGWFGSWLVPFLEEMGHTVFPESRHRHAPFGKFEYIIHASRAPAKNYTKYLEDGGEMLVCSSGAISHPTKQYKDYIEGKLEDEKIRGVKIARCFTFISKGMPTRYAAGKFLTDNPVRVYGGDHHRSYMHMSDCCEWLYAILHSGKRGIPYNVGSDFGISVRDMAKKIAVERRVSWEEDYREDYGMKNYVPDTTFTRCELGLQLKLRLGRAIRESIDIDA